MVRERITPYLTRPGYCVNKKRIQRPMRIMGIEAICPKLNKKEKENQIYPYLLEVSKYNEPQNLDNRLSSPYNKVGGQDEKYKR